MGKRLNTPTINFLSDFLGSGLWILIWNSGKLIYYMLVNACKNYNWFQY